jgi:hypothetical protein
MVRFFSHLQMESDVLRDMEKDIRTGGFNSDWMLAEEP